MNFFGEILALVVAMSWTVTALFAEVGSKRMGSLPFNAIRMTMSLLFLAAMMVVAFGVPYPLYADGKTWMWLLLSGVVGYVIGDYCLMQGYIIIGSRFGQLFMTLSAPTAAILGRLLIGETMKPLAIVGMFVTLTGIGMSVLSKKDNESTLHLSLPRRGVLYAAMAGICQGGGLVLSKVGLEHYDAAISACGLLSSSIPDGALLPLPLNVTIPFASTMMRGIMGLVGFVLLMTIMEKGWREKLNHAVRDRKAMLCAFGSMLFGPFVGVSLSLMATQYTATGIAQTIFALTPVLIIAPAALLFHQKVTFKEVIGAVISVAGVCLFFI